MRLPLFSRFSPGGRLVLIGSLICQITIMMTCVNVAVADARNEILIIESIGTSPINAEDPSSAEQAAINNALMLAVDKEIIYRGIFEGSIDLSVGSYNCLQVGFGNGLVVLPLPGLGEICSTGKELRIIRIEISVVQLSACRIELELSGPGWSLSQDYEQPLASMGHIVRNS